MRAQASRAAIITHADEIGEYTVKWSPRSISRWTTKRQARALLTLCNRRSPNPKRSTDGPGIATNLVDVMLRAGQIKAKIDAMTTTTTILESTGLK